MQIVPHLSPPQNDIERYNLQDPTDALVASPEPMGVSSSDSEEEEDAKIMLEAENDDESLDDATLITQIVPYLSPPQNDIERYNLQDPNDALVALPEPMVVSSSDSEEEEDAKTMLEAKNDDESLDDATLVMQVIKRTSTAK